MHYPQSLPPRVLLDTWYKISQQTVFDSARVEARKKLIALFAAITIV